MRELWGKYKLTFLAVLSLAFLGGVGIGAYFTESSLDTAAKIGEAATGISVFIALFAYILDRTNSEGQFVYEINQRYTHDVLFPTAKLLQDIRTNINPKFGESLNRIRTLTLEAYQSEHPIQVQEQSQVVIYDEVRRSAIYSIFCNLEEIAGAILFRRMEKNPGLATMREALVETVELFALFILIESPTLDTTAYCDTKRLYESWRDKVKFVSRTDREKAVQGLIQSQLELSS